jgi:N-succinyldiaminopimelate aminotransferase
MNPLLDTLQPYPFEKLTRLKHGIYPSADLRPIALSIGEPKHPTPDFIGAALSANLSGLTQYPASKGLPELREGIAHWLRRRFELPAGAIDPDRHILPCNGTREALFAFAQAVVDPSRQPLVLMPNPFYQIYEGAALLAGAQPYFLDTTRETDYLPDFGQVPDAIWARCQLLYICSPGNPTGAVLPAESHRRLIELAERHDFIIASDECYSELYQDESTPPPGLLQTAWAMGNSDFRRCVIFHSLSKRSNAPGLRSGFIAGDAEVLRRFLLYRTYHGCALSIPVQKASLAAWNDEDHVVANRELYRRKFSAVSDILADVMDFTVPPAGFYLWPRTPGDDQSFARELFAQTNVTVLPGSYLSRDHDGDDPGRGHVRMALVAPLEECVEAAHRIAEFVRQG